MAKHRLLRVNELVRRQLSMIITRDMHFEDVLVTVNQVDVTPDLKNAHVFVSVLGKGSAQGVIAQLEANRVVLQQEMAKDVVLKYTPHLTFHLDDSIERGDRVFKILREIEPALDTEEHDEDAEQG
ncbi:MAG: 30S ribosome-binding factor RbfA [Verrucomicrobiota bacterium]|nr:30S ribosome-binding factor RbfA [Verrucomicrobiota bacterium]